jgi:hypothetical protein
VSTDHGEDGQDDGEFWSARIDRALEDRAADEDDWNRNLEMAASAKVVMEGVEDSDCIYVNGLLSTQRYMVPNLVFQNPSFLVKPKRKDDETTFRLAQACANGAAEDVDLEEQAQDGIKDALYTDNGILKVGWVNENVDVEHAFEEDGSDRFEDKSEQVPLSVTKPEHITIGLGSGMTTYRVSSWNFVRSVGSTCIDNAAWVAERIYMRLEDVLQIPGLQHAEQIESNATPKNRGEHATGRRISARSRSEVTAAQALADPNDQLVELWEVWCRHCRKVFLICPGVHKALRVTDWPYDLNGAYPFIDLQITRLPDQQHSISYFTAVRSLIEAKNKIASFMLLQAKLSVGKTGINTNMVDPEEREKLRQGDAGTTFDCNGPVAEAVGTYMPPDLHNNLIVIMQYLENAIAEMTGTADFIRGANPSDDKLATTVKAQQAASNVRVADMRRRVGRWLTRWARLAIMLHKQFLDETLSVRVAGTDGFEWVEFSGTDLHGAYDFSVVPGSMQPVDIETQRMQMNDAINVLGPFIAPGSLQINGNELVRPYVETFPTAVADKILGSVPDVPPSDPEVENWWLAHGGNPPVSKREDFMAHRAAHAAAIQFLLAEPEPNLRAIDRLKRHLEATDEVEQQVALEALAKAQMEMQMAAAAAGAGGAPGEGGVKRGPGAGGPAAGGPLRPRMLAERQTDATKKTGAAQREPA